MRIIIILLSFMLISSCSTVKLQQHRNDKNTYTKKIILPKVNQIHIPGEFNSNWHFIGVDDNYNFSVEVNESSIKLANINNKNIYSFIERKTINKISINIPYKYYLGNWLLDCYLKQYLLVQLTTYDSNGLFVNNETSNNLKWLQFGHNTIAEKEYKYICKHEYANLGY